MLVLQAVSLCWGVRRVRVSAVCWACRGFRGRALEEELEDDGHDPEGSGIDGQGAGAAVGRLLRRALFAKLRKSAAMEVLGRRRRRTFWIMISAGSGRW